VGREKELIKVTIIRQERVRKMEKKRRARERSKEEGKEPGLRRVCQWLTGDALKKGP